FVGRLTREIALFAAERVEQWIGATRWIRWRWVRRVRLYADRLRAPQPLSTAEGDRSLSLSEDGRTIAARKRRWKGAAARSRESRNSVWAKMQRVCASADAYSRGPYADRAAGFQLHRATRSEEHT